MRGQRRSAQAGHHGLKHHVPGVYAHALHRRRHAYAQHAARHAPLGPVGLVPLEPYRALAARNANEQHHAHHCHRYGGRYRRAHHAHARAPDRYLKAHQVHRARGIYEEEIANNVDDIGREVCLHGRLGIARAAQYAREHHARKVRDVAKRHHPDIRRGDRRHLRLRAQHYRQRAAYRLHQQEEERAQHQAHSQSLPRHAARALYVARANALRHQHGRAHLYRRAGTVEQPARRGVHRHGGGGVLAQAAHHRGIHKGYQRHHYVFQYRRPGDMPHAPEVIR